MSFVTVMILRSWVVFSSDLRGAFDVADLTSEDEKMSSSLRSRVSALAGIVLIILYSIVMMANGGDAPWAWLLLVLGLAALFDANRSRISPNGSSDSDVVGEDH